MFISTYLDLIVIYFRFKMITDSISKLFTTLLQKILYNKAYYFRDKSIKLRSNLSR